MAVKRKTDNKPTLLEQANKILNDSIVQGTFDPSKALAADGSAAARLRAIGLASVNSGSKSAFYAIYVRAFLKEYLIKLENSNVIPPYHGVLTTDEATFKRDFILKIKRLLRADSRVLCAKAYLVAPDFATKVGGEDDE